MAENGKRPATYADIEAAPEHLVAEIINGELMTHLRPSPRHGGTANALSAKLTSPFQWGSGSPGGWVFFVEPEVKFGGDLLVPDIAGWVRVPPFDAISFSLADLWPLDPPLGMNEDPTPYYAGDR